MIDPYFHDFVRRSSSDRMVGEDFWSGGARLPTVVFIFPAELLVLHKFTELLVLVVHIRILAGNYRTKGGADQSELRCTRGGGSTRRFLPASPDDLRHKCQDKV